MPHIMDRSKSISLPSFSSIPMLWSKINLFRLREDWRWANRWQKIWCLSRYWFFMFMLLLRFDKGFDSLGNERRRFRLFYFDRAVHIGTQESHIMPLLEAEMSNGPKWYLVSVTGNHYSLSMTLRFIKTSPFKDLNIKDNIWSLEWSNNYQKSRVRSRNKSTTHWRW